MYKDFSTGTGVAKTFDKDSLTDFGMQLQGGYFIVLGAWEIVANPVRSIPACTAPAR